MKYDRGRESAAQQRKWKGAREKQIIYVAGLCQIDRLQRLEQLRDTRAVLDSATSKNTGHKNNDKKKNLCDSVANMLER